METEKEKGRQDDNGRADGNGGKPSTADEACDGGQTLTETEEKVDRFFAILRRAHVAEKYFERRLPSKKRKRSERFGLEDPVETNGVSNGGCEGGRVGDRVGSPKPDLDLNSKP
ncbi:PREDICTED: protein NIM1-INTERACTING 2 [Tarenaya hassleriana]|uniref:protein NIM1-INTERACTING 2 n=1 Tax=Tarenaya hassleriana TaxID=28532 RepID=UPI00053C27F6|nr:PREDICTED: protein NIM1-INTERACTING 2 [Tarenaya hassleriana]